MPEVIAFAGPCLPSAPDAAWRRLLERVGLRPPARRGDMIAALADDTRTLVLLDGLYYTVPAVTHKELLYVLDAGVRVIGAASLGALRAAEMEPFGMIGVGRVFEQYRDGALDGDDEVALLHAPRDLGYRPVTVALVELRHALGQLIEEGAVDRLESERLIRAVKRLAFSERHPERLLDLARQHLGAGHREGLRRALRSCDLKQRDARQALELALTEAPTGRPRRRSSTGFLGYYRDWHLRPAGSDDDGSRGPTFVQVWQTAALLHPEIGTLARAVRVRFLLSSAAVRAGLEPAARVVAARVRQLDAHLRRGAAAALPAPEVADEARVQVLAERACERFGNPRAAYRALLEELGPDLRTRRGDPLRLVETEAELMPLWSLVRAFVFTSAFAPALAATWAALRVYRCFERWAVGSRISRHSLVEIAAQRWGCEPERIPLEAAKRGIFESPGFFPGFREALQLIAPAERLNTPINEYPQAVQRLRATPIVHLFQDALDDMAEGVLAERRTAFLEPHAEPPVFRRTGIR